jgi:large conductance mechanosensitive channel
LGMLSEFKAFAMRGNVVDLAVGVVIGGAFGQIVSSLVEKIIMPVVGYLTGGIDLSKAAHSIKLPVGDPINIGWGAFVQAIINFLIIAFVIFLLVKAMNSMKKAEAAAPAVPPEDVLLLREIRDALKK